MGAMLNDTHAQSSDRKQTPSARKPRETLAIAKTALQQIEALSLPADPPNFELWYIYADGQNPSLNAEINSLVESKRVLTEADLEDLHARYLNLASVSDSVERYSPHSVRRNPRCRGDD
jgi:hypothetical protein